MRWWRNWRKTRPDGIRVAGAEVVDREVVVDANLITSRNPDDLPAFNRAIIDALVEELAEDAA